MNKLNILLNKNISNKEKFDNIMRFAIELLDEYDRKTKNSIKEASNHPIFNLVRLLGKNLEYELMKEMIVNNNEPKVDVREVLFDMSDSRILGNEQRYTYFKKVEFKKSIELKKEVVLPWPWDRRRLLSSMCNFGTELLCGEWKEDKLNHYIELWLPLGICWVKGGNHSITTGILQGEGYITPKVYDISRYYEKVICDGSYYRLKQDNIKLSKVKNIEFATIFEIGRLIKEKGINFNPSNLKK